MGARRGKLIVVDGTEGAGKGTQIEKLEAYLIAQGVGVTRTREPGGTPMAEEIRQSLLAPRDEVVDHKTEALMMWAARRQNIARVILPALDRGDWVICDRSVPSTLAYQVYGRGLPKEDVIDPFMGLVMEDLRPDLTIILDVDPRTGGERARARGQLDRMEQEEVAFFERVRAGYHAYLELDDRAKRVDGSGSVHEVAAAVRATIQPLLSRRLPERSADSPSP